MTMRTRCEKCGTVYRVPESYQGRKARCSKCGSVITVSEDLTCWLDAVSQVMEEHGPIGPEGEAPGPAPQPPEETPPSTAHEPAPPGVEPAHG